METRYEGGKTWGCSDMSVNRYEVGEIWGWSVMRVVRHEAGLIKGWSVMKVFRNNGGQVWGLPYNILKEWYDKKANSPIKKWTKDLYRHLSKEEIHMANRHMKRCLTLLPIREMQINTTMSYHLTPTRMAVINKIGNTKRQTGCGEKESVKHSGGNANRCSHYGKQYRDSSKNWE